MDHVVGSIRQVTSIMAEIMSASAEQSAGIDKVHQAVGHMDEVTQQNAALMEEASAAAHSLQEQADKLAKMVDMFKLNAVLATQPSTAVPGPTRPLAAPPAPKRKRLPIPPIARGEDWQEF